MRIAFRTLSVMASIAVLGLSSFDASAAGIRVRCDTSANRTKISVDGKGLVPGEQYRARVISGGRGVNSPFAVANANREVEFDFDTNPRDIAQGATAIPRNFIRNNKVTARILDRDGFVEATDTVACRAR